MSGDRCRCQVSGVRCSRSRVNQQSLQSAICNLSPTVFRRTPSDQLNRMFHQIVQHRQPSRTPLGLPGRFTISALRLERRRGRERVRRDESGVRRHPQRLGDARRFPLQTHFVSPPASRPVRLSPVPPVVRIRSASVVVGPFDEGRGDALGLIGDQAPVPLPQSRAFPAHAAIASPERRPARRENRRRRS